jgi:hypothetical protein
MMGEPSISKIKRRTDALPKILSVFALIWIWRIQVDFSSQIMFIIKSIKRELKTRPIYDKVVYYKSRKRELKAKLMNESV